MRRRGPKAGLLSLWLFEYDTFCSELITQFGSSDYPPLARTGCFHVEFFTFLVRRSPTGLAYITYPTDVSRFGSDCPNGTGGRGRQPASRHKFLSHPLCGLKDKSKSKGEDNGQCMRRTDLRLSTSPGSARPTLPRVLRFQPLLTALDCDEVNATRSTREKPIFLPHRTSHTGAWSARGAQISTGPVWFLRAGRLDSRKRFARRRP